MFKVLFEKAFYQSGGHLLLRTLKPLTNRQSKVNWHKSSDVNLLILSPVPMLEVIEYRDKFQPDFKRLNLEWLDKYDLTEEADLLVLNDPFHEIINKGGFIWLAKSDDQIVGSAALMNEGHGFYELAKMSVAPSHQGKGISKILIEKCLDKAREIGAKKILLFSNHQLKTALVLYEKYGFVQVVLNDSPFVTADIKMELNL